MMFGLGRQSFARARKDVLVRSFTATRRAMRYHSRI